jgi:ADP-ribose pyrophosphatase YjhB (NUDIX family)
MKRMVVHSNGIVKNHASGAVLRAIPGLKQVSPCLFEAGLCRILLPDRYFRTITRPGWAACPRNAETRSNAVSRLFETGVLVKYCCECARELTKAWIASEQRERSVCESCGITHFENPKIIVCGIVCWRDKLLLCRRANEPGKNKWMVPGGFLECNETLEAGAARETFEETGVCIDPKELALYSVVNVTATNQVLISFRVILSSLPELSPGPECLEATFMSESEVREADFAWRVSMGDGLARFFNELRSGNFSIQLITLASDKGSEFSWREYRLQRPG